MRPILAGGRAPVCWQHDLARSTARLDALRRACAWIKVFTEVRPRLGDELLLGSCLAELAAEVAHPIESEPEAVVRPARPKSTGPPTRERRPMGEVVGPIRPPGSETPAARPSTPPRASHRPGAPQPRATVPDLTGLPRQASHALLGRLAGEPTRSFGQEPPRRSLTVSPGEGEHPRRLGALRAEAKRDRTSLRLRP